jgi:Rrf2 family protein
MFSQTVEYAMRAVVFLAEAAPAPRTADQIAAATKAPKAYMAKVLRQLVRGGVVRSQRGSGGGVTLARTPAETTLLDVVQAVEPIRRIATCPLGLKAHAHQLCPLHHRLDEALAMVEDAFRRSTLEEMLSGSTGTFPLDIRLPSRVQPNRQEG